MIAQTIKLMSWQFVQLKDPSGLRLELVDGEIAASRSPTLKHSYADKALSFFLGRHIDECNLGILLGYVNTNFSEYDVRRPDLVYIAKHRVHLVGEKAMEGPPDLCVEIISPSSSTIDRKQKFKQYEKGKVAHYWIVDPTAKTIEGYKLEKGKFRLTGDGKNNDVVRLPPFPDLNIHLSQLWWRR